MGWSSWGKVQMGMVIGQALQDTSYFQTQLPNFNNQGVSYMNLDANGSWSDSQWQQYITTVHGQGQKAGIYWTPWIWWNGDNPPTQSDLSNLVEGSNYTYGDIVMRDPYGNPLRSWDGGYALDPTHPGTLQRVDFYYLKFSTVGFDSIKFDFLSHGIAEGGSNNGAHYVSTVQTGVQAYNYGMAYLAKKFGATMYMDESIAPIFPYQYAHARRVSCDTFGGIGSPTVNSGGTTSYEMNSASYGWWLAGRLYNFNDPDQIVMEGFTTNDRDPGLHDRWRRPHRFGGSGASAEVADQSQRQRSIGAQAELPSGGRRHRQLCSTGTGGAVGQYLLPGGLQLRPQQSAGAEHRSGPRRVEQHKQLHRHRPMDRQ